MGVSLKILIAEIDLFRSVGGGQTVYQNIIRQRRADEFYYFVQNEAADNPRPANAHPIPLRSHFRRFMADEPRYQHLLWCYRDALDMAGSVQQALGSAHFDVVDTPDYRQTGLFLRRAFEMHGIHVDRVVLALHGTLSSAFRTAWPWRGNAGRDFAELVLRERLQVQTVDGRYAISKSYATEIQKRADFPIALLDPLLTVAQTEPGPSEPSTTRPDIVFIGRREKRKGPDLFVDLAWWLPQGLFGKARLIGADGANHQGTGGDAILSRMARMRNVKLEFSPSLDQAGLRQVRHKKSVVIASSRYDQFNLVALESILDGCPTLVAETAGVAAFIREKLPALSWLIVDFQCDRIAAKPLTDILVNYEKRREEILAALRAADLKPDVSSLNRIYEGDAVFNRRARERIDDISDHLALFALREAPRRDRAALSPWLLRLRSIWRAPGVRRVRGLLRPLARGAFATARGFKRWLRGVADVVRHPKAAARRFLVKHVLATMDLEESLVGEAAKIPAIPAIRRDLSFNVMRTSKEMRERISYLSTLVSSHKVDRIRYFREMMAHERERGNALVAATYGMRILRWQGRDQFQLREQVSAALADGGFAREAEVVELMYGGAPDADARSRSYLDRQLSLNRTKKDLPLEFSEDMRGAKPVRASIIVSLYNAADKIPTFLRMLSQQTMIKRGECEVVFIDSGSPGGDHGAFQQAIAATPMPALYARSENRETIQAAWNRGIKLARGDALAFLGVDEAIHPECMDILSDTLDRNPNVDWVMSDSIVTELDKRETLSHDIMKYDRRGYRQDWHYLDSTFLSYVGGLYRKSIHDRVGYYDESFRAAGDTEFKNRVLPFIQTKYVSKTLGVFNNYPEERTTQHPRAEIEDLRAWYLFRTRAGVSYAFDQRPEEQAFLLLQDALRYRKCYCEHWSTDLDLAASLARYLAERGKGRGAVQRQKAIDDLLRQFRALELMRNRPSTLGLLGDFSNVWTYVRDARTKHKSLFSLNEMPAYNILNDNRYEQHWWSWSTP